MNRGSEQLATYAGEQSVDLVTMTKGQASVFIDGLKKLSGGAHRLRSQQPRRCAGRPRAAEASRPADATPVNEKQIHAMERLAQQQGSTSTWKRAAALAWWRTA